MTQKFNKNESEMKPKNVSYLQWCALFGLKVLHLRQIRFPVVTSRGFDGIAAAATAPTPTAAAPTNFAAVTEEDDESCPGGRMLESFLGSFIWGVEFNFSKEEDVVGAGMGSASGGTAPGFVVIAWKCE